MKRIFIIFLCLSFLFSITGVTFAANNIVESPNYKVFLNCNPVNIVDTPVTVNNELMLTDTDLLGILGIKLDSKSAIWDTKKTSLTLIYGTTKLIITMGSNKAKLNNKIVLLNATPTAYKGKKYFPVTTIVQVFGKEAAADIYLKCFYIRNNSDFIKTRLLLEKAVATMNSLDRYKQTNNDRNIYTNLADQTKDESSNSSYFEIDRKNENELYYSESMLLNSVFKYYSYVIGRTEYTNSEFGSGLGAWKREIVSEKSFEDHIAGDDYRNYVNLRDVLYAGLQLTSSTDGKSNILKGNIFPICSFQQHDKEYQKMMVPEIKDGSIEIEISKTTNCITRITNHFCYIDETKQSDYFTDILYDKINDGTNIQLPEYIVNDLKVNPAVAEEPTLSINDSEQTVINNLYDTAQMVAIDGGFKEPYDLSTSEAILFIILKDAKSLESFNKLSDNAIKIFINNCIQDNFGEYLGCSNVHGIVVFDKKKYVSADASYRVDPSKLNLSRYSKAVAVNIVKQNKANNTYENYYK
jgi:hypothetical protein